MSDRDVITRGDLPHWYVPGAAHFVTYRLADTLPAGVMRRLRYERTARLNQDPLPDESRWAQKVRVHKQFFAAYDRHLDQSTSVCWLQNPAVAEVVISNLYHHHQEKYQLLEYSVMPNHVHVLLVPIVNVDAASFVADAASVRIPVMESNDSAPDYFSGEIADAKSPLSKIMHSLKSYTANEANRILNRSGPFWQRESYDHWVRDHAELNRIAEYIANNPIRANLVQNAWDWPCCSAYDRRHPRAKSLARW